MATTKKKNVEAKTVEIFDKHIKSYIETGCVGFDLAVSNGRGLPEGSNLLMFAPPGCGKTTLIADILRRLLKTYELIGVPFRVVYIDTENSKSLLECMGKDPKDPSEIGLKKYITEIHRGEDPDYLPQQLLYYPNVSSFTETEEIYDRYLNNDDQKENQDVKIIVVDSLTNLVSTTLKEVAVDKPDFGSNARERTRFYGKWMARTREKNVTVIYTSQMRQKQNASAYEDPYRAAVTKADEHQMDVIMKLSKSVDSKRTVLKKVKQKTIDGIVEKQTRYVLKLITAKAQATKNRLWDAVDVECLVKPGCKILNAFTVFNLLEQNGLFRRINSINYSATPELAAAFPDIDFGDLEKGQPKRDLNIITSRNMGRFIEYLKNNGLYSATVGIVEDLDDGLEA